MLPILAPARPAKFMSSSQGPRRWGCFSFTDEKQVQRRRETCPGCRQGRCQAYCLAGEWFSLRPPCLQDTQNNPLTCIHFRPLPSAGHACKGRADSRCLCLEEQSVKEGWAPQFTAVPPSSSSRWHWLAFLLAGPFAARDVVQLDSPALSQEHFLTLHCLY